MKPAPLDYLRAETADEALAVLAEHGEEARVLAGGQSLMAILNMRLASPRVLVDISRCKDLAYTQINGTLSVGAATTQAAVEARPGLATEAPLLAQALPHIGHFQTRNRGTVCGSIAHADPSAELPLVLTVLGGEVELRSAKRRRTLPVKDFFRGMLLTARAPDELVAEVRFPCPRTGERHGFVEVGMRHGDYAVVALAAVVGPRSIRLAAGGVADRPVAVDWPRLDGGALEDALNEFAWELGAQDDLHASARYRRHLVRRCGKQLIEGLL